MTDGRPYADQDNDDDIDHDAAAQQQAAEQQQQNDTGHQPADKGDEPRRMKRSELLRENAQLRALLQRADTLLKAGARATAQNDSAAAPAAIATDGNAEMDTFGDVDAFLAQMDAELPATAAALEGATEVPQQPAPAAATPAPAIGQPALAEQPAAAAAVPAGQPAAAAPAQQALAMPCKDDILAAMQVINILDSQGIYHVSAAQLHLAQRVFKACLDAATPLTEEQDQLVAKAMQHAHMTELLSGEHAQQRVNDKQFHHHIREEVKFLQANEGRPSVDGADSTTVAKLLAASGTDPQLLRLISKPECFTGSENSKSVRTWFSSVENWLDTVDCKPQYKVKVAALYLRGKAEQHWLAVKPQIAASGENPAQWDVFKKWMILGFGAVDPETSARQKIDTAQQKGSVEQYVRYLQSLFAELTERPMSEADKVHAFIRGLKDSIAERVALDPLTRKPYTSFMEAAQAAILIDSACGVRRRKHAEPLNQAMQKKRTHPYGAATNRLKFLKEKYGKAAEVGANKPAGKGHGNGANGNGSGNGKNGNSQYVPKSVKDARSAAGQCIQCGSSSHKKCDNWRR